MVPEQCEIHMSQNLQCTCNLRQFAMENPHEDYTQIIEQWATAQNKLADLACEQTVYSLLMSPMMLAADQSFGE